MTANNVQVSVVHGGDMEPLIQIYDANQIKATLIKMNLEAAQKLVEDLIGSIEMVENLMAGPDDVTH